MSIVVNVVYGEEINLTLTTASAPQTNLAESNSFIPLMKRGLESLLLFLELGCVLSFLIIAFTDAFHLFSVGLVITLIRFSDTSPANRIVFTFRFAEIKLV